MYFQGLILLVRVVAISIGFQYNSMILAVILFSLFSMLCWIGFLIWVAGHAKSQLHYLAKPLLKSLALAVICTLPLLITAVFELPALYWYAALLVTGLMSALYYFFVFKKRTHKPALNVLQPIAKYVINQVMQQSTVANSAGLINYFAQCVKKKDITRQNANK